MSSGRKHQALFIYIARFYNHHNAVRQSRIELIPGEISEPSLDELKQRRTKYTPRMLNFVAKQGKTLLQELGDGASQPPQLFNLLFLERSEELVEFRLPFTFRQPDPPAGVR